MSAAQHDCNGKAVMYHLGGLLQAVSGLAHADVKHQLGDTDLPHGVGCLLLVHYISDKTTEMRSRHAPNQGLKAA